MRLLKSVNTSLRQLYLTVFLLNARLSYVSEPDAAAPDEI